jgi:Big-like domain-containing protein
MSLSRVKGVAILSTVMLTLAACSDRGTVGPDTSDEPPTGMVLSNARNAATTSNTVNGRATISHSSDGTVSYISIAPGTYPTGLQAQIRNRTVGSLLRSVPITDGGFDPVAVAARAGDFLELKIWSRVGAPSVLTLKVPPRRPPTVVRSNPPKGRIDVALNQYLIVVFSEPIEPGSVNINSFRLEQAGKRISGSVRFVDNAWTAEFLPDQPLDAESAYELIVTEGVRDLDGDVLDGGYSATFRTGVEPCPGYAIPSSCPPFPTGGANAITGVVSERTAEGLRPLPGAVVYAWVQFSDHGYSRGGVESDAGGRYRIDLLPNTLIHLQGWAAGYNQPCGNVVILSGSEATVDIELVSENHPLPDAATAPPVVTGVVYEKVSDTRTPLAGVTMFFETWWDLVSATTTTDANGRYAMCRLPDLSYPQVVSALKEGYKTQSQPVFVERAMRTELDFELSR